MGNPRPSKRGSGDFLFHKLSDAPRAELNKQRDAHAAYENNRYINIPTPVSATDHRLIQHRIQDATPLSTLWLSDRQRAIHAVSNLWNFTIQNSHKVSYTSSPEISGLDKTLYSELYNHHHLVQRIITQGRIDHAALGNSNKLQHDIFIHGDLKPDNILVTDEDEVYIVDWERAGMGERKVDQASLAAGLLYTSIFASVKKKSTNWEFISQSFNDIQTITGLIIPNSVISHRVAQYLAVRAMGYVQSTEQIDRCSEILLRASKALA